VRTAFIEEIFRLAEEDANVTLIVGDLGFSVIEKFSARFPQQFVNAGVAEQNMVGLAAGMAMTGRTVFVYSIGNFPTLRCLEQIRNDICYHRAAVTIVTVGGGLAYGNLGSSHHATEDLAITRSLPEMVVVAPGDPVETAWATRALARLGGPAYLRLGRAGEPKVHRDNAVHFELGKAAEIRPGGDAILFSTGAMLSTAVQAADMLLHRDMTLGVMSMHTVRPLDETTVVAAARRVRHIFTLEEHSLIGGLGSAVAEVLAELGGEHARLTRLALPAEFSRTVGSQVHLLGRYGLDPDSVAQRIETTVMKGDGLVG